MRLCVAQEISRRGSGLEQQVSSRNMSDELIEDITQLLKQCSAPPENFWPSVIMVYATAVAIGDGQTLDEPSKTILHKQHHQMRFQVLLGILQESCQAWGFARQVYDQLSPRRSARPTSDATTLQQDVLSQNVSGILV